MEELWDALCHEDQEIEFPAWHAEILDKIKKKIESGEAEFINRQVRLSFNTVIKNYEKICC